MIKFISDADHYDIVLGCASKAGRSLWIGTADIKDLYVERGKTKRPFLSVMSGLIDKGVEVRLIHAKEPGEAFRDDFDKFPLLAGHLERVLCPRVHFKLVIVDSSFCYVGSANLTGAGMGMKSALRRNFEAGIFTDEPAVLLPAMEEFDKVWRGSECRKCQRKQYCADPVV